MTDMQSIKVNDKVRTVRPVKTPYGFNVKEGSVGTVHRIIRHQPVLALVVQFMGNRCTMVVPASDVAVVN